MKYIIIFLTLTYTSFLFANSPNVDIAYPNGGEVFFSNTDNSIYWTGDSSEVLSLYYKTDDDIEWNLIEHNLKGNQYNWSVPNEVGNNFRVKLERSFETDETGFKQSNNYGSKFGAVGFRIFETADGNILLAGEIEDPEGDVITYYGYKDIWLLKVNEQGDILWQSTLGTTGSDDLVDMIQLDDKGFLISAVADSADIDATKNEGRGDVLLIRLDENGNKIWSKSYGGIHRDVGKSITVDRDGNYLLCGNTASDQADFYRDVSLKDDAFIMKVDQQGDLIWTKFFVGDMWEDIIRVFPTEDGYTIVGHTSSTKGDFERISEKKDIFIKKLDNDWNTLKTIYIGGNSNERVFDATLDEDKTLYLTGFTLSNDMDFEDKKINDAAFVGSIDDNLNINWLNTYGGTESSRLYSMSKRRNGTLGIAGFTLAKDGDIDENKGEYDAWYINVDKSGNLLWSKTFGGRNRDRFNHICPSNENLVIGYSNSSDYDVASKSNNHVEIWMATLTAGSYYLTDSSDNTFSVIPQPTSSVDLLYPTNIDIVDPTKDIRIEWTGENSNVVSLYYSTNEGENWKLITDSATNNMYIWKPNDSLLVDNCKIKIQHKVKVFEETDIEWKRTYDSYNHNSSYFGIESYENGMLIVTKSRTDQLDRKSEARGEHDVWIISVDSLGIIKWENSYGGNKDDFASKIIKTQDSNYIMVGNTYSNSHGLVNEGKLDYWIVKIDRYGREIFSKSYGGNKDDIATNIIELDDSYLVYGISDSDTNNYIENMKRNYHNWFLKIDKTGNLISSSQSIEIPMSTFGSILKKDDKYQAVGIYGGNVPEKIRRGGPLYGSGLVLSQFDSNGNLDWVKLIAENRIYNKVYLFNNNDSTSTIIADVDDDDESRIASDIIALKINDSGTIISKKEFEFSKYLHEMTSVVKAEDQGFYLTYIQDFEKTHFYPNDKYDNPVINFVRMDKDFNTVWDSVYGGTDWEGAGEGLLLKDNSYLLIGSTASWDGDVVRNYFSKRIDYKNRKSAVWIIKFRKTHYPFEAITDVSFATEQKDPVFDFIVYPNMTTGNVKIKVKLKEELYSTINLYDNLGRLVEVIFEGDLSNNEEIIDYSTKPLAPGRYYVNLITGEFETTKVLEVLR